MERLFLQGGAMALFLVAGRLRPRVPGVPLVHRDLVLNLLNGLVLFAFAWAVIEPLTAGAEVGLVDGALLGPPAAQFLVAFLLLDFTRYWVHRADHRVPWLWTFHRVHHSAEVLDATTGLRMHLVDFVQLAAIPVLLFGVLIDTSGFAPWVVPAAMGVGVVMDAWQHANLRVDTSSALFRAWDALFNNPHFHCWHHTRDGELHDGNYGNTLTIWDRLFGSCVSRPEPPEAYGLDETQALDNTLWGWHLLRRRATAG